MLDAAGRHAVDGDGDGGDRWVYAVWGKADRTKVRRPDAADHHNRMHLRDDDFDEDDETEYAVAPGDAVWYEVKWHGVEAVDPDDPVAGSNPTRDDYEDEEEAETWNAVIRFVPRRECPYGCVFERGCGVCVPGRGVRRRHAPVAHRRRR